MSAAPSGSRALQALFWVGVCFSVLILLLVLGSLTGRNRAEYSTLGHAKSGDRPEYIETLLDNPEIKNSKTDQLRWFISRYGKPDHDDSTQYDHPRPPFVTRWLDYGREQIRVSFYPVDGGIDTNYRSLSPPYRDWRIIGFIDMATKQKISPADALSRLAGQGRRIEEMIPITKSRCRVLCFTAGVTAQT